MSDEQRNSSRGLMMPRRPRTRAQRPGQRHRPTNAVTTSNSRIAHDGSNAVKPPLFAATSNPPLRRGDGEEAPLAGHALELVSAAVLELES